MERFMFFVRLLLITSVAALVVASCTPARAQPIEADGVAPPPPTCNDGVVWHRSADITFCATTCTSDIDCASGERCRVLDETRAPEEGTLYAEDVQEEFVAAQDDAALAEEAPMFDEPPVCEGACAPYTGDLEIRPSPPFAVCDPFHDVAGAMLSAADEDAIAAQVDAD
jgi:hypothetical protein